MRSTLPDVLCLVLAVAVSASNAITPDKIESTSLHQRALVNQKKHISSESRSKESKGETMKLQEPDLRKQRIVTEKQRIAKAHHEVDAKIRSNNERSAKEKPAKEVHQKQERVMKESSPKVRKTKELTAKEKSFKAHRDKEITFKKNGRDETKVKAMLAKSVVTEERKQKMMAKHETTAKEHHTKRVARKFALKQFLKETRHKEHKLDAQISQKKKEMQNNHKDDKYLEMLRDPVQRILRTQSNQLSKNERKAKLGELKASRQSMELTQKIAEVKSGKVDPKSTHKHKKGKKELQEMQDDHAKQNSQPRHEHPPKGGDTRQGKRIPLKVEEQGSFWKSKQVWYIASAVLAVVVSIVVAAVIMKRKDAPDLNKVYDQMNKTPDSFGQL